MYRKPEHDNRETHTNDNRTSCDETETDEAVGSLRLPVKDNKPLKTSMSESHSVASRWSGASAASRTTTTLRCASAPRAMLWSVSTLSLRSSIRCSARLGAVSAPCFFFFSSRRRHTRYIGDWSSDVCSSD